MIDDFDMIVYRWDPHEVFYKTLFEKKKKGGLEYQKFLGQLDVKHLQEEGLVVPDLYEPFEIFGETTPIFDVNGDIAVWKHSRYTPPYEHAHRYFEIVCVVEGEAVHRVNENTVIMKMKRGDICILPDNVKHSVEVMEDKGIVINIMIKKSTFQYAFFDILSSDNMLSNFFQGALLNSNSATYLYFKTGNSADDTIVRCIKALFLNYYNHKKYCDKMLKHLASCMFILLLRNYDKYYVPDKNSQKELKILQYLREHYADATLEGAAKYFNYSTAYLSRMVKKHTGSNFTELLMRYRMELACRLLRESALQIGIISEIVGYKNLEHFNRKFKQLYQKTPTQYRKENQKTDQKRSNNK